MPGKQLILLLICTLIILPAQIATADVDIHTNNNRLSIDSGGEMKIQTAPNSWIRIPENRSIYFRVWRPNKNWQCNGRNITYQSSLKNGFGQNRIYTSTTTTTCQ